MPEPKLTTPAPAPIGSEEWWHSTPLFGERGLMDAVLLLVKLQLVTRSRGRELVFAVMQREARNVPEAPWHLLPEDWSE